MTRRTCTECDRPMRTRGEAPDDAPGTVAAHSRVTCQTCHKRRVRGPSSRLPRTPSIEAGDPCAGCGLPMRPTRTVATDHPGTRRYGGNGRCEPCYRRGDGAGTRARESSTPFARYMPTDPITINGFDDPDPSVRSTARQAQALLDERRRRGIPPQGTGAYKPSPREVIAA